MSSDSAHPQPLVFEQSRLGFVDMDAVDLPRTNADGEPGVEPTPEQRYLFDTQGWILIPGVLPADEVEEMRAFCERLHRNPESLPEDERSPIAGPLERLTDHPVIVGFMNEFLAHPALSSQDCYGFRMESTSLCVRSAGEGIAMPRVAVRPPDKRAHKEARRDARTPQPLHRAPRVRLVRRKRLSECVDV